MYVHCYSSELFVAKSKCERGLSVPFIRLVQRIQSLSVRLHRCHSTAFAERRPYYSRGPHRPNALETSAIHPISVLQLLPILAYADINQQWQGALAASKNSSRFISPRLLRANPVYIYHNWIFQSHASRSCDQVWFSSCSG